MLSLILDGMNPGQVSEIFFFVPGQTMFKLSEYILLQQSNINRQYERNQSKGILGRSQVYFPTRADLLCSQHYESDPSDGIFGRSQVYIPAQADLLCFESCKRVLQERHENEPYVRAFVHNTTTEPCTRAISKRPIQKSYQRNF